MSALLIGCSKKKKAKGDKAKPAQPGAAKKETMKMRRVSCGRSSSAYSTTNGNISIHETSREGKFIVLKNIHRSEEENIGGWKLKRTIDENREIVYSIPQDFVLGPEKTVKIWARDQGGIHNGVDQLIFEEEDTFGVGSNVHTALYNKSASNFILTFKEMRRPLMPTTTYDHSHLTPSPLYHRPPRALIVDLQDILSAQSATDSKKLICYIYNCEVSFVKSNSFKDWESNAVIHKP
ncbi:lamin tail domain-containing protein [Ditylenchus destructor]|nr:lamin tail domain-containing protein [Ditylenchus destructor]